MKLTEFFNAIYIVNLKRRADRKQECLDELVANGMTANDVIFWEAFDHPTNGHQGCTRSHRALIRHIANSDMKRVLVLEDDFKAVTLPILAKAGHSQGRIVWDTFSTVLNGGGNLNERFAYLSKFLPAQWDVIYLGCGYGEAPISRLNKHVIRCGFMQGTHAYGITKDFASIWDERVNTSLGSPDLERHPGPIDNTFGSMSKDFMYYVFQPRLIYQRESMSDLTNQVCCHLDSNTNSYHENLV